MIFAATARERTAGMAKQSAYLQRREADVRQEHMDRVMTQIISGKQELIPFAERYPELKKVRYGR